MTRQDLDEIKRLLVAYRAVRYPPHRYRCRRPLETALVRHVDDLIAAAEATMPPQQHEQSQNVIDRRAQNAL